MPKVNREKYRFGERLPALKPDALGDATHAVLQIKGGEEVNIPGPENGGQGRDVIRIVFHEFPENVWWPNPSSVNLIFDKLGDDTDAWVDQFVPLHRVSTKNPRVPGAKVDSLWAVPEEEWDAQVAEYEKERAEEEAKAKRPAAPAARRK